jgi:hypothetical protein
MVLLLLVTAAAVRLPSIDVPPLDFHPVRQYHSLILARANYLDMVDPSPEWQRHVATISEQRQASWEPPIIEHLAAFGFRIAGGEHFWIPRLQSSLFWLAGGVLVYLIGRRLADQNAAVFSTAVYLLDPFAVTASRSFQPDPLMVLGVLAGVFAILRYYDQPSTPQLLLAGFIATVAILVKFVGLFPILGAFFSAGIATRGLRGFLRDPSLIVFLGIGTGPALVVYADRVFVSQTLLSPAQGDILPQLLVQPLFWSGWMHQLGTVLGFPLLVAAFIGTLLFRRGLPRAVVLGLWAGYLALGLVFTYTIHTHDYWNLPVVPIAALAVGPVGALILERLQQVCRSSPSRAAAAAIVCLTVLLAADSARPHVDRSAFTASTATAQAIGTEVGHSTRTLYLSSDYGLPLEYHGYLSGRPWPLASDLAWERLAGMRMIDASTRFKQQLDAYPPEYFIIADLPEFEQQPDLKQLLTDNFPVIARGQDYLVFDLRGQASRPPQ